MGLFELIFGEKDPALAWVADRGLKIELDLDRHALCDIVPGDPVDRISRLGRPSNEEPTKHEHYVYRRFGVQLEADEGNVWGFVIVFDASTPHAEAGAFVGEVIHRGQKLAWNDRTREEELVARLGEPYWRSAENHEVLLFYEFGDIEWQFELTADGRLRVVNIQTPPLLAEEGQRRFHGVTRPWPP
jgi:hypothetical protein